MLVFRSPRRDDQKRACPGVFSCSDTIFDGRSGCLSFSFSRYAAVAIYFLSMSSLISGRGLKNGGGTYKPDRPLESGTSRIRSDIAACNQTAGADLCQPVGAAVKTAS